MTHKNPQPTHYLAFLIAQVEPQGQSIGWLEQKLHTLSREGVLPQEVFSYDTSSAYSPQVTQGLQALVHEGSLQTAGPYATHKPTDHLYAHAQDAKQLIPPEQQGPLKEYGKKLTNGPPAVAVSLSITKN